MSEDGKELCYILTVEIKRREAQISRWLIQVFDGDPLSSGVWVVFEWEAHQPHFSLFFVQSKKLSQMSRDSVFQACGLVVHNRVTRWRVHLWPPPESIFTCFYIHHWSSLSTRIMHDKVQEEGRLQDGLSTCSPPLERAPAPWTTPGTSLTIDRVFVCVLNLREPGFTLRTKNYCPINKGIRGL